SAADKGFPIAFRSMAILAENQGDRDKAAALNLQTLNRVIHSCWTTVARHLLQQQESPDRAASRRVVKDLLLWAARLGSEPARQTLGEFYPSNTLTRPPEASAPEVADFSSLPPWLQ